MGIFDPDGKLAVFLNTLGSLILLNLLALLCMLPVITAGASMTALYSMTMRIVRKEETGIVRGFFQAFRSNFRKATAIWLMGGGLILFLVFDIRLLGSLSGNIWLIYRVLLFVFIIMLAILLMHAFALTARFENTVKNTLKNALIIAGSHILQAILMAFVTAIPLILPALSLRFFSLDFLLGLSGPAWIVSFYFVLLFGPLESKEAA